MVTNYILKGSLNRKIIAIHLQYKNTASWSKSRLQIALKIAPSAQITVIEM